MFNSRRSYAAGIRDPFIQNVIAGICVAFSSGVFASLNLLGAGGGRPESAQVVQTTNAILSSIWFFSSCFGGTFLNALGPGPTLSAGVATYAFYVASLWYFEETGHQALPLTAGAVIGVGAGMVFITSGYISVSYPEEKNKGKYIATQINLMALGSVSCGILPVLLNRDNAAQGGVPRTFYVIILVIMSCAACLALLLKRPEDLRRSDGSVVAIDKARSFRDEIKANLNTLRDWKVLAMLPAFLPAGAFFIYDGSINVFQNNLRARSLCPLAAVVAQIPCGYGLQYILDHPRWTRRFRSLAGLTLVAVPLLGTWTAEILRVSNVDRSTPPEAVLDWKDPQFGRVMTMFVLIWVCSVLWTYLVPYFIGALTNSPVKLSHYMGVWRGVLAAGEAIGFGLDAKRIQYVHFAGGILALYATGIVVLYWIGISQIRESCYFQPGEEGAVIPEHVLREKSGWFGSQDEKEIVSDA